MRDEFGRANKIVIITGANSGIGKAAAIQFASNGWHVVMACRDTLSSAAVMHEIMEQTKSTHVSLLQLDVSSFASIHQFNERLREHYDHIDCIIHNAAHFKHGQRQWQGSVDGIELTFAANTFGPFLLTHLLLDLLQKSDDARVLHACSTNIKHFFDPKRSIEWNLIANTNSDASQTRPYNSYKMYGDSKMALFMLTRKMAEEWKPYGIKVNALQISGVRMSKRTLRNLSGLWKLAAHMQNLIFPLPDAMANNYYEICSNAKFKEMSGQLFNDKLGIIQPAELNVKLTERIKYIVGSNHYPSYALDSGRTDQLWRLCNEVCLAR